MPCWGTSGLLNPSSSNCCCADRSGDDDFPAQPLVALEALRRALVTVSHECTGSRGKSGAKGIGRDSTWLDTLSDATRFADMIAFSGLAVLTQLRHDHLIKQYLVAAMLEDGVAASTHAVADPPQLSVSRKRPRGNANNGPGGSSDDAVLHKAKGTTLEEAEMHAMQRRPRVLRSNAKGSIDAWLNALQKSDLDAVLEFLTLSPSANLMRCLCAVGFVAFWRSECTSDRVPRGMTVERILQVLIACHDGLLTAALFQLMCAPDSDDHSFDHGVVSLLHMEGLIQFLFPTEGYVALINVYWSPLATGGACVPPSQTRGKSITKSLRAKMLQCCTLIAPFFCSGVFGGMDVPRGAKYYPAAQQLLRAWCRVFAKMTENKGDSPIQPESLNG